MMLKFFPEVLFFFFSSALKLMGFIVKTKTPFWGMLYLFWVCETKTGVVRILVIFQDRHMFSHIIQKVWARAFH